MNLCLTIFKDGSYTIESEEEVEKTKQENIWLLSLPLPRIARNALEFEREECAEICEEHPEEHPFNLAEMIRNRSKKETK